MKPAWARPASSTELAAHVEAGGGLVAVGTCLELVDRAMPFGPIVQALRDLHRQLDPATQAAVVGDAEPALARLLPELAGGVRADDADDGAALFEHLLGTLIGSATMCRRCSSSKTCTGPITPPATSSCSSPATCATRACSWSGRSAPTIYTAATRCDRCSPSSTGRAPRIGSISCASTATRSPS